MRFISDFVKFLCAATALVLAGCGGGGVTSTPITTPTPSVPAPTITLSFAASTSNIGVPNILTWTSTNATSCSGSDGLSGALLPTSSISVIPTGGGQFIYTLSCTGAGSTVSKTTQLNVPFPAKSTSYANAKENGVGTENIPNVAVQGYTVLAYAFADFQQNGTMSLVTHSLEYDASKPQTKNSVGKVAFWSKNAAGAWDNITSKLLANTTGCLHARKAVVADFNGDTKPDVFFACTGFDTAPFTGEQQVMLLSQNDGSYKTDVLPVTCYCHGASAAELNTAGYADIAVTDTATDKGSFMLINNKNGTFSKDFSAMPAAVQGKAIFTAELLDHNRDGKVDLFLAGIEQDHPASFTPTIFHNNGANSFNDVAPLVFAKDTVFTTTLDIVVDGDNTYLLRTPTDYMGTAIQKIDKDGAATTIFQNKGYLDKAKNLVWIDWIVISNGKIVSANAMYNVAVAK